MVRRASFFLGAAKCRCPRGFALAPGILLWLFFSPLGRHPWNAETVDVEHSSIRKPTGTAEIISTFEVQKPFGIDIEQDV